MTRAEVAMTFAIAYLDDGLMPSGSPDEWDEQDRETVQLRNLLAEAIADLQLRDIR